MEEFDDVEELSKSKNGSLLLQLIEVRIKHSSTAIANNTNKLDVRSYLLLDALVYPCEKF